MATSSDWVTFTDFSYRKLETCQNTSSVVPTNSWLSNQSPSRVAIHLSPTFLISTLYWYLVGSAEPLEWTYSNPAVTASPEALTSGLLHEVKVPESAATVAKVAKALFQAFCIFATPFSKYFLTFFRVKNMN